MTAPTRRRFEGHRMGTEASMARPSCLDRVLTCADFSLRTIAFSRPSRPERTLPYGWAPIAAEARDGEVSVCEVGEIVLYRHSALTYVRIPP